MNEIKMFLYDFNEWTVIIRLMCAALMGGLIGSERGRHGRAAGLRTHILVCIGAAICSLTSLFLVEQLGYAGDVARISAQVISGIGFLGAGTILIKNSSMITGLTTAAGMWATAAIGIAIGYGFYIAAVIATIICIFSVTVLSKLEGARKRAVTIYIELTQIADTENVVDIIQELDNKLISYDIIPAKSGQAENVGVVVVISEDCDYSELRRSICENNNVAMMINNINV